MSMRVRFPAPDECNPYYFTYINELRGDQDIIAALRAQRGAAAALLSGVTEAQAGRKPEPDAWSIKQVLGHLIDTERLFVFRALWFARGEQRELPGMEPNPWVALAGFDNRPLAALFDELDHVRTATVHFFEALDEPAWQRGGVASGNRITVHAIAWIIAGHELHHLASLREVYLRQ